MSILCGTGVRHLSRIVNEETAKQIKRCYTQGRAIYAIKTAHTIAIVRRHYIIG